MAAIIATQELLDQARLAYHKLLTGVSAREVVDQNGERVTFTAANRQSLYNYILELDAQLNPTPSGTAPSNGPMTFLF